MATAWLLRRHAPTLKVRVVNVVDLMCLFVPEAHPHGLSHEKFVAVFTANRPVVFAFHGYRRAIHAVLHGRPHEERFHVRGFKEEGTTTTPFDMVVRNGLSRFHLSAEAARRAASPDADAVATWCGSMIARHEAYIREEFEDMPEVRDWHWSDR